MKTLGISGLAHDAAVTLIEDGKILFAVEHERVIRAKDRWEFPAESIEFCLKHFNVDKREIHSIAYYWDDAGNFSSAIKAELKNWFRPNIKTLRRLAKRYGATRSNQLVKQKMKQIWGDIPLPPVSFVDHHLAHAHYATKVSGYDRCLTMVVDGRGESSTLTVYRYKAGKFTVLQQNHMPDSIGYFYGAITQHLGFKPVSDEYRVMGLAPYGKPCAQYDDFFNRLVRCEKGRFILDTRYFDFQNDESTKSRWLDKKAFQYLGPPRNHDEQLEGKHQDIAYSLQKHYEKIVLQLIDFYSNKFNEKNIVLSGGCAMNSVFNGLYLMNRPKSGLFIPVAPGDQGAAIGAALSLYTHQQCQQHLISNREARLGPDYGDDDIVQALSSSGKSWQRLTHADKVAAELLVKKKVGAIFDGRMEFGPRALGARSIIASPCDAENREKINFAVKQRELFRPFAGVILQEHLTDWVQGVTESYFPYMNYVFTLKKDKGHRIPAICHIDGSCRLQTVNESDGLISGILREFYRITGVPVILNTSFNQNREPIVMSPEDAISCFERSNLDFIILGDFLMEQ